MTAERLIERIKARGGRVHCMPSRMVFCLTDDTELRDGLIALGGRFHSTADIKGEKGYKRGDHLEWDIWIHQIPVEGPTTIYEAAGGKLPAVQEPGGSSSESGPVEA